MRQCLHLTLLMLGGVGRLFGTSARLVGLSRMPVAHLPAETLFILDGTAMIYRSFYSPSTSAQYGESVTADGVDCSAVVAACMQLARVVSALKPRYLVVAFDRRGGTFREELYPPYKQNRKAMPEQLAAQIHMVAPAFEALGARCFEALGFEADDVMASLAAWARTKALNAVVVSEDKDMLQLVRTGVHVLRSIYPPDLYLLGDDEIRAKYGVSAAQLRCYFALVGDAADNIPGVRGVGPVLARTLLNHFGSIEAIVLAKESDATAFEESLRACLQSSRDQGGRGASLPRVLALLGSVSATQMTLFKQLVTLRSDVNALTNVRAVPSVDKGINLETLASADLRYLGERAGAEAQLSSVSVSLTEPLRILRRSYHLLDRCP